VKSDRLEDHIMHAEFIDVSRKDIESFSSVFKLYAVGTTSLRTLESIYWMGVKAFINPEIDLHQLEIKQWDVYDELQAYNLTRNEAISHLLTWMNNRNLNRILCRTQILIAPGYKARMAGGLITNFHQPQSTLLLLIAAITGPDWRIIYQYALDNNFRFLSYGDGMLIEFDET
jgi:S-adenosylmethionine:tRNA ribosyltransferase-isomerase